MTQLQTTWTDGSNYISAGPLGNGAMLLSNSMGEHTVVSGEEWLARLDNLKDAGWYRSE